MSFKPRLCKWCGGEFTPWASQCRYCCDECRDAGKRENLEKNKRKQAEAKLKKPPPAVSVDEVLRFANDYRHRTGHYPHYGEAVALMEKERSGKQ